MTSCDSHSDRPSTQDPVVRIFDTTLRDGEQSPGASLTRDEKMTLAHEIAALGVDVIEAGFPAASPDDAAAVAQVAREVGRGDGPVVCGLARAHRGDIQTAFESVRHASKPRIHTFLATSDLHLEHKLGMSRAQVIDKVGEMVAFAGSLCADVEFSPEDAGRSDPEFLIQVLTVAIQAGATTLNIPDTVGYMLPHEYGALFERLIRDTPGSDGVIWSAHCHDDLGLATANTLAALHAGARQAEVTVNGIGERAGNTSLEEVVMALKTRAAVTGLRTRIETPRITRVSGLVSHHTGMVVPPNKAVVGRNAFAHEAGIHQDGMLKNQKTYEIMTPESVGRNQSRLVLGKHSGRHALRVRLEELGYSLDKEDLGSAFTRFKEIADRKKHVTDSDLRAIAQKRQDDAPPEGFEIVDLQVHCSRPGTPTATVRLRTPKGEERVAPAVGSGSVDAIFRAIQSIVDVPNVLVDFCIETLSEGIDAIGQVSVRVATHAGARRSYGGYGTDRDILVAGAKAYLAAVNRLVAEQRPFAGRRRAAEAVAAAPAGVEETYDPSYTVI